MDLEGYSNRTTPYSITTIEPIYAEPVALLDESVRIHSVATDTTSFPATRGKPGKIVGSVVRSVGL